MVADELRAAEKALLYATHGAQPSEKVVIERAFDNLAGYPVESPAFIPLPSWVDACKAAQAEGLVKTDVRKTKTGRSMVAVAVTADLPARSKANVRQVVTAPRNMAAVFTGQKTASSPAPSAALPAPTGETPQQGASDAITGKLEALMRMGMARDAAITFLSQ